MPTMTSWANIASVGKLYRAGHVALPKKKGRFAIMSETNGSSQTPTRTAYNSRSKMITEGDVRAPNRSMLRAVGLTDEDFNKPLIGVASTWSEITPCNAHINRLA